MIEGIHSLLASRQLHVATSRPPYRYSVLCSAYSLGTGILGAFEDVLRFAFIIGGIIPSLACTFVLLGIFFHIPRMAAAFICKGFWMYMHARVRGSTTKRKNEGKPWYCRHLGCCYSCRAASAVISGEASITGHVACCQCGRAI